VLAVTLGRVASVCLSVRCGVLQSGSGCEVDGSKSVVGETRFAIISDCSAKVDSLEVEVDEDTD
jgi:hypothetical protein